MAIENEVRHLVTKMDPNFPLDAKPPWQIKQGYFDLINPNKHLRVRIINGQRAFLCTKEGKGYSREEQEERIGVRPASFLFNQCSSYLEKTRYFPKHRVEDGEWTIDFFKDPLGGIVIAEFEHQLPIEEVILPPWILKTKDVTDSVSNVHLARLATELRETGEVKTPLMLYEEIIPKTIPRIVITGGPCSGKSRILRVVKEKMGNIVHCVPEVATILIAQVGINPKTNPRRFNSSLYRIQVIFEATSAEQALDENKKAMLLDRGSVDNAAYMGGRLVDFAALLKTTPEYEYSKYQVVICLEVSPRGVYERYKYNNTARKENYHEAVLLGEDIKQVWKGHPNLFLVPNYDSWKEKEETVLYIIRKFLDGK